MRIILMRHAESTANIDSMIISGVSLDASLTQTGRQHTKVIATKTRPIQSTINNVYVSPTLRTKQTAARHPHRLSHPRPRRMGRF